MPTVAGYESGVTFSASKWATISEQYEWELVEHGSCSTRKLTALTDISTKSTRNSIKIFCQGSVIPLCDEKGHGLRGIRTLVGLELIHCAFLYNLYVENTSYPLDRYVEELFQELRIIVHFSFMHRWFENISLYRGSLRVTLAFPADRNSWSTVEMLRMFI